MSEWFFERRDGKAVRRLGRYASAALARVPAVALALMLAGPWPAAAEPIEVAYRPVALDPSNPDQRRIGDLVFRGGLHLTSPDPGFGGFSALGVSADGRRLVALTDMGQRLNARLLYDRHGDLAGIADADLGPMSGLDGQPLSMRQESDAEAMSPGVEGEIIVAFERDHRLWRYFPGKATPEPLPPPFELARAPSNGGIEALTLLDDGRLLAITESFGTGVNVVGWVSDASAWSVLTYATTGGYRPTGADTLPGGDVVVLERRFTLRGTGAARLMRLDSDSIAPGAELRGRVLAEFLPPVTVDNFEGIAARRGEHAETLVYVLSDDNFNAEQRTLLMMFALDE